MEFNYKILFYTCIVFLSYNKVSHCFRSIALKSMYPYTMEQWELSIINIYCIYCGNNLFQTFEDNTTRRLDDYKQFGAYVIKNSLILENEVAWNQKDPVEAATELYTYLDIDPTYSNNHGVLNFQQVQDSNRHNLQFNLTPRIPPELGFMPLDTDNTNNAILGCLNYFNERIKLNFLTCLNKLLENVDLSTEDEMEIRRRVGLLFLCNNGALWFKRIFISDPMDNEPYKSYALRALRNGEVPVYRMIYESIYNLGEYVNDDFDYENGMLQMPYTILYMAIITKC